MHNNIHSIHSNYCTAQVYSHLPQTTALYTSPQEYGITKEEKLYIGKTICNPLLGKIRSDLHHVVFDESSDINHRLDPRLSRDIFTPMRHVRTRLYFTSESHIHCIINILRYGGLFGVSYAATLECTLGLLSLGCYEIRAPL